MKSEVKTRRAPNFKFVIFAKKAYDSSNITITNTIIIIIIIIVDIILMCNQVVLAQERSPTVVGWSAN